MADYRAISTGVYSDLARWEVWDGSAWVAATVLPTVADDVYANGYTVTIDVDSFASSYRNGPLASGVAQNGTFLINDGITAVGDFIGLGSLNNGACLTGSAGEKWIVGDVISNSAAGVLNGSHGIYTTAGKFNIVGDPIALSIGGGTVAVNRNVPVKVVGGLVEIFGNPTSIAGNGINAAVLNQGVNGNVIIHGRAVGSGVTRIGAINCIIEECEGRNDNCIVTSKFIMPTTNQPTWVSCLAKVGADVQIEIYDELGNAVICNPLFAQGQASPADVRLNTAYANGALTGTAAIPPAASVALNVPVDATVGTLDYSIDTAAVGNAVGQYITPQVLSAVTS